MPKGAYHLMYSGAPRVMLLTHLVERDENYVALAKQHPNTYKILDNSLIELGGATSMERLVTAAEEVGADEIILPDVFKDADLTIWKVKESIQWLKDKGLLGKYKLMAVCHGATREAFLKCFDTLEKMPAVDVIGIPKVMCSFDWVNNSRANLYPIFKNSTKEIHFLGVWYNLGEILSLPKEVYNKVRSVDTCMFALDVIQNIDFFTDRKGTIDLEKEYSELTEDKYNALMDRFEKLMVSKQLGIINY